MSRDYRSQWWRPNWRNTFYSVWVTHTQSSAEIFLHLCIGCPHVYDYTSQYIVCTFWAERSMMVGTEKSFDFHATVLLIMKRVPNGVQSRAWCAAGQKCNRISLLSHIYIRREVLFFFSHLSPIWWPNLFILILHTCPLYNRQKGVGALCRLRNGIHEQSWYSRVYLHTHRLNSIAS